MTTTEKSKYEEQRERTIAVLRRMVAEKREYEKQAIENYKNDPELQAFVANLDKKTPNVEHLSPKYEFDCKELGLLCIQNGKQYSV